MDHFTVQTCCVVFDINIPDFTCIIYRQYQLIIMFAHALYIIKYNIEGCNYFELSTNYLIKNYFKR